MADVLSDGLIILFGGQIFVSPRIRLRAGHNAGDIRVFTRRRTWLGATAAVLEPTRLLLLALLLAGAFARTLVLRRTGLLHGASESYCPRRTLIVTGRHRNGSRSDGHVANSTETGYA
jgi:hypothetical protein